MLTHKKLLAHTSFKTLLISLSYIPNRITRLKFKWIFNLIAITKFPPFSEENCLPLGLEQENIRSAWGVRNFSNFQKLNKHTDKKPHNNPAMTGMSKGYRG